MAALSGIYRATVVDVTDPNRKRRLLVQVAPAQNAEPMWAEACIPYRSRSIPPVGSTVWIMFEEGDVTRPVWIGTHS